MATGSAERLLSKPKSDKEADAPTGLWSDPPSMPKRASKARSKPTLIGSPVPAIPLTKADPQKAPKARPIPKRPLPPKLPPAALMPPIPKTSRLAKIKLVTRPSDPAPDAIPEDDDALLMSDPPTFETPGEVDPEVAFKVEPTPPPEAPASPPPLPPLPKPAAIPVEHKALPEPLPVAERSDEKLVPPRLLSSLPPPPVELRSPFETLEPAPLGPVASDTASGFDLRSAGIGFAIGAVIVAVIALALWPSETDTVASNGVSNTGASNGASNTGASNTGAVAPPPETPQPIAEETGAEETGAEETGAEETDAEETGAEETGAEETSAEETSAPRRAARPARSRPRARPTPRTRPRPAPVARTTPRPRTDGPVIDSERTARPVRRAASGNRPATPTRQDVAAAIQAIRPQLRQCAPDLHGHVANVRFTFVSSGRATSALVPNNFGTPQARSCVARVARQARVPQFADPRLVVTYPVQF